MIFHKSSVLLLPLSVALICFGAEGCCGIPNGIAISQANGWVKESMPPGTSADAASKFLESKGFGVWTDRSTNPAELRASKHIGRCWLNITYDDLFVFSQLDDSDRVVTTNVYTGVSPGI